MQDPRRLPRRSKQQTRELMLLAGTLVTDDLVFSDEAAQLSRWLAHVRLERVLDVTKQLQLYLELHEDEVPVGGVTPAWLDRHRDEILALDTSAYRDIAKPTAYTVFDSEHDFRARLAEYLLTQRVSDAPQLQSVARHLAGDDDAGPPPFAAFVAEIADLEFERTRSLASPQVELGTAPFLGNPTIRALLRRSREDSAHGEDGHIAFYQYLLELHGLRMRDGSEVADLHVALTSLIQGMVFHERVWPESVRRDIAWEDGPRTVFSLSAEAILRFFTEPDPGAGEAGRR